MKHLIKIQVEVFKIASLLKDIKRAKDGPSIFLGGDCSDNEWREEIKKEFDKLDFMDPYDKNWDTENIYDECAGLLLAHYVIFYKGGDLTKNEKDFLKNVGKDFKSFDNLTDLKKYLRVITQIIDEYDAINKLHKKEVVL